ncbi:lysylphosphatidylglycerol synthase transmembrane domain-containing protein [Actinomycetospora termitidis]|uniref:Lysylphosphatidylglycerol synthase transmembrane domain-containing protein n=1 Tax=Actinomycetospora termitidis TaxID=3053470 RepID=A0ABT7M7E6_9PSEU|nr:lysylphosphatidylglycerol synthase transmembrane domain-containing protein [Actinomycetospora sp. Odt1-22]MDL5156591.1 lysylphosphatidylglycerol synthase transmembrane domain-containing protein [Actinomycetospora sp. Odt1-22]
MRFVKLLVGALLVAAVVVHLGTGAVVDGLRAVSGSSLAAALVIGFVTTAASAARWCLVARGVGLRLAPGRALADCYRAQFLNSVLPAGVLGDVHRAVDHGRRNADVARGVRAVVIERVAGQVVVIATCAALLVALPSPARELVDPVTVLTVLAVVVAVALAVVSLASRSRRPVAARLRRGRAMAESFVDDLRDGLLRRGTGPGVVGLSLVATVGHLALLAVAAGPVAPLGTLLPLLALALLAMGLPVNVGGWGPREAAMAAAFGAAGLGAEAGLTAAVTYGVLALVSCLPGAGVLLLGRIALPRPAQADAAAPANSPRLTYRTRPASVA